MTLAGYEPSASTHSPRAPSIIVLGTDALLAALPATPVQLAHACLQAGYEQVVPASWGDELVAQVVLRKLDESRPAAAIQCSCPLVSQRLLASGSDLSPFLVSVVPPPVALARYLRSVYARSGVLLTYVGRCPGAVHDDIDERLTPQELLAQLAERGMDAAGQPRVFDSVVPPDRRRFYSQPGGLPSTDQLWTGGGQRTLAELGAGDVASELVEVLLSGREVLVDAASRMGCFCSGAIEGANAPDARARVVALEPPRAASPVVRPPNGVALDVPIARPAVRAEGEHPRPTVSELPEDPRQPQGGPSRRRSPSHGIARPVLGAAPITRDPDGRHLPRTYVARRRSTPRPFRVQIDVTGDSVTISEATGSMAAVEPTVDVAHVDVAHDEAPVREREVRLLVTPVDSNGDAITADQAAVATAVAASPTPSPPQADEAAPAADRASSEGRLGHQGAAATVEVVDPTPSAPAEQSEPSRPRERYGPSSSQRPRSDRGAHGPQVHKPFTERVVIPPERRSVSARAPGRLWIRLLLVAVVIVLSVALGVVLGRWFAQPPATPAGVAPAKSAPQSGQSPSKQPRPADTSLIDAL